VVAFIDVTERKRTEEALSGMNRRLMEAQEQERTRIARELHDDINQRLALLAVQLGIIQQSPSLEDSEVSSRMNELRQDISEISIDLQALSHRLHSSKLEYLGAVAAMKSWCQEFGERQKMEIEFKSHDVPGPLPSDVSLCLFRVLQEAMHNASKHSGVRHIEVELRGSRGEIHLLVQDSGAGFDVEEATKGPGIGLSSMRERVKMINGAITIRSQPKGGTTVHVCVPFASADDSRLAAG
jgi:signal transduction histidine kinase